jgi:hypothetical protein
MSAEADAPYSKDLFLLTLKGQVTVHLIDGHTLDGEFATQDLWNIFLMVDGEPMMIPRSQILYIKGARGQQIEPDTSQAAFFKAESAPDTLPKADLAVHSVAETIGNGEDIYTAGTGITEPETAEMPSFTASEEADTGETVVEQAAVVPVVEEEPDLTYVLGDTADLADELEKISAPEGDWDDLTVVLDEEEEEDEITYILDSEEEQQVAARLVCTSGPHVGQQFELKGEITSLGRARDSDVALSLDKEISRHHAVIRLEADKFVIQDQNSLNGTYVNNERVGAPRALQDGDIILVGLSDLKYEE